MENLPLDFFVTSMQFTKHVHRDQYPAIDPTSPELSMAGKVVIITGASRGLGARGFAPAFAKAGAKGIVLVARDAAKLDAVAKEIHEINPNVQVLAVSTDISDEKSVASLYEKVAATFGHADILINNAGLFGAQGTIKDVDPSVWWQDFSVNTGGTFRMTSAYLRALPETSHGTIITMTSGMAYQVFPGTSAYSLSKLINLQMAALVAVENPNVTSIALHPGLVLTEMTAEPFKKFSLDTPELIGGTGVALCTEKGRAFSGRFIACNWDIDDLNEKAKEIEAGKLLQIDLTGTFGAEQFQ